MSERKVVGRGTAIGLGLVCVVLMASLVGLMLYYNVQVSRLDNDKDTLENYKSQLETWLAGNITQLQNQINSLNNYIFIKNSQISALTEYKNQLEAWLAGNITQLQNQVDSLNDTVSLVQWNYIFGGNGMSQTAGSYSAWVFYTNYFGYVVVDVESSTTDTTYVQVIYSSHDVNYDQMIPVGKRGIATFRILPSTSVEVRVGNNNVFYSATEAFAIKYYYNTNQTVLIKP